ncbi:MAG: arsenite methyltransferase [Kouleothrix sp.]|jgi:SAM-dependent methyltransferase|nr:arsenite methyltransferase [Kouleothrix sp.]
MTNTTITPDEIKAGVREHYGKAIQSSCCGPSSSNAGCGDSAAGACCADTTSTELRLYGADALASLPGDVVTTSFGCGNPIAIASLQPGEIVLDLGSGGGLDVLLASKRVGPAGFVYGLDMTDEMLAVARRNAEKAGVSNVEFIKGDIEHIPLPDQSITVIISNCVVNLSPDKGQVLHEAFRVLQPGGRVAISDIVVDGSLEGLPVSEAQIRSALSWAGCIAGALTIDQYRQLLGAAGFEQVEVDIRHRYTVEDLLSDAPEVLANLDRGLVETLVGRFTSSSISARRPAY